MFAIEWPDDDEFGHLISSSRCFCKKHREDNRTSDVQVRMESGSRLQLPSSVFRLREDGSELLAKYNKEVRESSPRGEVSLHVSAATKLRLMRERSLSRRGESDSRSSSDSSPPTSGGDSDFIDDNVTSTTLASIIEEGIGPGAVSPTRLPTDEAPVDFVPDDDDDYPSNPDSGDEPEAEDDTRSQSDVASIIDEGIDHDTESPHTVTSSLHEAAYEHDQQMQVLREAEERSHLTRARHLNAAARATARTARRPPAPPTRGQRLPTAAVASPGSEVVIQPRQRGHQDLLTEAEIAGVDPRMQNLLLHSSAAAQHQEFSAMLLRMAALEQKLLDSEARAQARAHLTMTGGAVANHLHLPQWEREFEARMDAVTWAVFEDCQLPATVEGAKCLDITCPKIPPKGAKFCQCGAPTCILDLKCQHPACGEPCHGSVADMLEQHICYHCREPLLYKLPPHLRSDMAQKYSKLSATVGYKKAPPPDLSCIPKEFWITEHENRLIMAHRRSSTTEVLGEGTNSAYEALSEIKFQTNAFSQGEVMGDDLDFSFTAKSLVAAFKGPHFGRGLMASVADLLPAAGVNSYTMYIEWTETIIKGDTAEIDWDVPDGPSILKRYLEFMCVVMEKVPGSTLARDHSRACIQINTAVKAAGSQSVNWMTRKAFEKYAAALGSYHSMCIAWVSGSKFFNKLYGEDLLWNHIGTDGQMPMFVLRYFKDGVGTWISLLDKQYDRPQRLAIDAAALELVESNNSSRGAGLPMGRMGQQPALGSAAVLSSKKMERRDFVKHNSGNDVLASQHTFNWKSQDDTWRECSIRLCYKCFGPHITATCTAEQHPHAMSSTTEDGRKQYIMDVAVFSKVLEKHLLLPAQWVGAYKTMAKHIMTTRLQHRPAPSASGVMEGRPTSETVKLEAVRQGEAIARKDIPQLGLSDLRATAHVSEQRDTPPELKSDYHQYPIIGVRDIDLGLPSVMPGSELRFTGKLLDRDENLNTERGEEEKRCLMVQLCDQKKADSKKTFKRCREQSLIFMDRALHIKDAYRHLNHLTNVDRHINCSIRSHSDITARNQALSPYFLKDSWLEEFGDGPIAIWTITDDTVELVIFILAADAKRTAPLDSKVSHICAYLGHAYEIRWDQPLDTLADLLDVIPRLHRSMGVALDLCTHLSETLKGSPPVVPPYLAAKESLSKLVRFLDGVPSGKMVGKQSTPSTLQAQCDAGVQDCTKLAPMVHINWMPWLQTLAQTVMRWTYITLMHYFTPEVMQVPTSTQHQPLPATSTSNSSTPNSTSSDASNGVPISEQATPPEGGEPEHGCSCSDTDGSNRCQQGAGCHNCCDGSESEDYPPHEVQYEHVQGEQLCTCKCATCRTRCERIESTIMIDNCHLFAAVLLQSELVFSDDYMYRWYIRCKFRTWALLGMQRIHLMPDVLEINGLLVRGISYAAGTKLWKRTVKPGQSSARLERSHMRLYQWAAYEMLYASKLGIKLDVLPLLSDADEVFSVDLSDPDILQWHRRRLLTMVAIMGNHESETLTLNPHTGIFNECPILRIQQMTYLSETADRLLHAIRTRRMSRSVNAVVLHATMRDRPESANLGTTRDLQVFADAHGMGIFQQLHPMAATAYEDMMSDMPRFRGEPLASRLRGIADFCFCCHLPFYADGGSCRMPEGELHGSLFCGLCWNGVVTDYTTRDCLTLIRKVRAIQRWYRNPRIAHCDLLADHNGADIHGHFTTCSDPPDRVQYYFRPHLIRQYSSNYPTYVSVLPTNANECHFDSHLSRWTCSGHRHCLMCNRRIVLDKCNSHPDRMKSFCPRCWSDHNDQCKQMLKMPWAVIPPADEQSVPRPANTTQAAPSAERRMGTNSSFDTNQCEPMMCLQGSMLSAINFGETDTAVPNRCSVQVLSMDSDLKAWSDWLQFCARLGKPILPPFTSELDEAATKAQTLCFVLYETSLYSIPTDDALRKVLAVGRQLVLRGHPNPYFGVPVASRQILDLSSPEPGINQRISDSSDEFHRVLVTPEPVKSQPTHTLAVATSVRVVPDVLSKIHFTANDSAPLKIHFLVPEPKPKSKCTAFLVTGSCGQCDCDPKCPKPVEVSSKSPKKKKQRAGRHVQARRAFVELFNNEIRPCLRCQLDMISIYHGNKVRNFCDHCWLTSRDQCLASQQRAFRLGLISIGSQSKMQRTRLQILKNEHAQSADQSCTDRPLPTSGRMGSKTQASKGEMVAELAMDHLQHTVPYTAGSYENCTVDDDRPEVDVHDYMYDALNEPTFEDLGDAAVTNISNHLHMMADSEAFYSDSGELEVAQTVDELSQSCQALMLQRGMMIMWNCISVLLLTSTHVAATVRDVLGHGMLAGASWLTNKIFDLWRRPIISSFCPSMTNNVQQYNMRTRNFYATGDHYPVVQCPTTLTLARLAQWVSCSGYDNRGQRAWAVLASKVKWAGHLSDNFWLIRLTRSIEPGAPEVIVQRAVQGLRRSAESLRRKPKTSLSAVLVAEELYMQSAAFKKECDNTVQLAKKAAHICSIDGCWCASQTEAGFLNACSLDHALALLDVSDLTDSISVYQLSTFPEFKEFIQHLKLERYDDNGLLPEYCSSSYHRADQCYLCSHSIAGKGHSVQKVSFCQQCWDESHSRSQLALDHHVKFQALWSNHDTSSNSSFEDLDDSHYSTNLAAWHYRPNGSWHSRYHSPPASAQVNQSASPLQQLQSAIARRRCVLEGDDWLSRQADKFPVPVTASNTRLRASPAATQRWFPEYRRSASMDTNMSSSRSSDGLADEAPISSWLKQRQRVLSSGSAVIPVKTLPAYLLCMPSAEAHRLNMRRNQQSKIAQYFR